MHSVKNTDKGHFSLRYLFTTESPLYYNYLKKILEQCVMDKYF